MFNSNGDVIGVVRDGALTCFNYAYCATIGEIIAEVSHMQDQISAMLTLWHNCSHAHNVHLQELARHHHVPVCGCLTCLITCLHPHNLGTWGNQLEV